MAKNVAHARKITRSMHGDWGYDSNGFGRRSVRRNGSFFNTATTILNEDERLASIGLKRTGRVTIKHN